MTLSICAAAAPSVSSSSSSAYGTVSGHVGHSKAPSVSLPADGKDSIGFAVVTSRPACNTEAVLPVLVDANAVLADVTDWLWAHVNGGERKRVYEGSGEGDRGEGGGDAEPQLVAEQMDAGRQELDSTVSDLLDLTFAVLLCEFPCVYVLAITLRNTHTCTRLCITHCTVTVLQCNLSSSLFPADLFCIKSALPSP